MSKWEKLRRILRTDARPNRIALNTVGMDGEERIAFAKHYLAEMSRLDREEGEVPPGRVVSWCPQCGPEPRCDEDGCCAVCGCDVGEVPWYPPPPSREACEAAARFLRTWDPGPSVDREVLSAQCAEVDAFLCSLHAPTVPKEDHDE